MTDNAHGSGDRYMFWGALLVFVVFALNFLYFFVDDEAITFVYARHLLSGQGLTYSTYEGPTEGYSNLLHVWLATGILAAVGVLGLSKISALFAAKSLSFVSGILLLALVASLIRREVSDRYARIAALAVIALAGPVAVWSCSGLETMPFTLLFTAFAAALVFDGFVRWWGALALGAAVLLERIDGFAYVAAVAAAALLAAPPSQSRRAIVLRVALPLAAIFAAYTGWRYWYFGSLLSLPLQTKVLYRLMPHDVLVSYMPSRSYVARFLELYHPVVLLLLSTAWLPFWRPDQDRRPMALLLTFAALFTYAAVVGDWMFGFRFFATLFPLIALLTAHSLGAVTQRVPRAGPWLMLAVVIWAATTSRAFVRNYEHADRITAWRSWWADPSLAPDRYFGVFYPMYHDLDSRIPPGTVTINNSAGFLPFMLDLENIDDVGLCSRFFARLPTADVVFTEVGRYHPLTDRPPLRAGEQYLVFRNARYLVTLTDRLMLANAGHLPNRLLDGDLRLAMRSKYESLYERARPPRTNLNVEDFLENLAHPARIRRAVWRGVPLERGRVLEQLPFLASGERRYDVADTLSFEVHLPPDPIHQLWIDSIVPSADVDLELELYGRSGSVLCRDRLHLQGARHFGYYRVLDRPGPAGTFIMKLSTRGKPASVLVKDVRVLGQTPELRAYIESELFHGGSQTETGANDHY